MPRFSTDKTHLAAAGCRCTGICRRNDSVRHNPIFAPVKSLRRINRYCFGTCAADVRAHKIKKVLQINNLGFSRGIIYPDRCIKSCAQQHYILCCAHARIEQCHLTRGFFTEAAKYTAVCFAYPHPEPPQRPKVYVNRTFAEVTAAGITDNRRSAPRQNRTQEHNGRTHPSH